MILFFLHNCIECECLWQALSIAAKAYIEIFREHRRIKGRRSSSGLAHQLHAASENRNRARQALGDHEARHVTVLHEACSVLLTTRVGSLMKDKMAVALRVLTFIETHTNPIQSDVETLQRWVDQSDRNADPDELACIVIMAEVQRTKKAEIVRRSTTGATA
jgi:hypothetical protein